MADTPILYNFWRSSASYRLRIALEMKRIEHDLVPVDIPSGEVRGPENLARNPQGYVPVLDIDGLRLTQSAAILEYLDETRPDPALLPTDPEGRVRVRALADLIAMDIHPVCNPNVVNHVLSLAGGDNDMRVAWMKKFIARGFDALEVLLDDPRTGQFSHGDMVTLADLCIVPQVYNARRWGLNMADWPILERIDAACNELPAFQSGHPDQCQPT